ncbi:hypothetical protein DE146DRAFT_347981 [Phaeosphaeria sp. MPI-PUGE-AT-0046c]|nr:hypothetical protein DE146DRAFT_347981 [Phaeosphaeria sp. MPI-PUGE-AT-0046c]
MASPQESITTVNGRRCTRSRARTAATSVFTTQETTAVEAPQVTTATTAQEPPPAQQTSAAEAPPPPPPSSAAAAPPPSSPAIDQPAAAPTTTTQAAVSSAIGTISAAPISSAPVPPLAAAPAQSQQAVAVPQRPVAVSRPAAAAVPSDPVENAAAASPPVAPTSSDTLSTAALPPSVDASSLPAPLFTAPGAAESAVLQTSLAVGTAPTSQTGTSPEPTSADAPDAAQPLPTTTPLSSSPTGDAAAGIIGPEQGGSESEAGLTIPSSGDANIGSIVGGVVGGVAGLALICALLFFCLRKRKAKQPRWAEKHDQGPRFVDKLKSVPASVGLLVAKVKGMKKGPSKNPYQRHSPQDSVSSIYSTTESQGFYAPGDFSFAKRSPSRSSRSSKKSERNVLRKKNSSVSSQLTIKPILQKREIDISNPFADPEPPRILRLSNPDSSPQGPLTPQPAANSAQLSKDPFVSPLDPPGPFLAARGHTRTLSQASALSSHPPSFVFPSLNDPVNKVAIGPPPPSQAPPLAQKRRSSMALPTFDATSTAASGETDYTLFGEPGPSRPATRLFTPGPPTGRTVRQSDPFDLDRPEVLGFGSVVGRREVRGSVTRQPTRSRRTSTAGNWSTINDGPGFSWNMVPRR